MSTFPDSCVKSKALYERAKKNMPGGNTRTTVYMEPFPIYAAKGQGCKMWDIDGNEYYDCINNFTAMIHGYALKSVDTAVKKQLSFGTAFGAPTLSEIELAEVLTERLPGADSIRFANSGTESVMMAIKAARAFTERSKIVKIEGSYHGSYDFAEVSLDSCPDNWGDTPLSVQYAKGTPKGVLDDVIVVRFNNLNDLSDVFDLHGHEIAGVLIDPLPNRAGLIPADKHYINHLFSIAKSHGALVIFDEVISFRLGYSGAQGIWGVKPDLTALGKIIGGGYPVGAIAGRKEVMEVFDPTRGKPALPHGGTFTANPITMTAGLATMLELTPERIEKINRLGDICRSEINKSFSSHGVPGKCVGMGSLFKLHFIPSAVDDYRTGFVNKDTSKKLNFVHKSLLNKGVFSAGYGLFALSTPMSDCDIYKICKAVDEAIFELSKSKK